MKKVQWNSIDKKQNGLKYSKNDKSSTLPELEKECFLKHLRIAHGNSKNKIRQWNIGRRWENRNQYGKLHTGQEKICPDGLTSPRGRYSPKQWMNYLKNTIIHGPLEGKPFCHKGSALLLPDFITLCNCYHSRSFRRMF